MILEIKDLLKKDQNQYHDNGKGKPEKIMKTWGSKWRKKTEMDKQSPPSICIPNILLPQVECYNRKNSSLYWSLASHKLWDVVPCSECFLRKEHQPIYIYRKAIIYKGVCMDTHTF